MDQEKPVDPNKAAVHEGFPAALFMAIEPELPLVGTSLQKKTPHAQRSPAHENDDDERFPAALFMDIKPELRRVRKNFQKKTAHAQTGVSRRSPGHENDDDQPPHEVKIDTGMLRQFAECIRNVSSSNPNPECSIYITPPDIRDFDPKAYTPKVVSIGPFHYKNPSGWDETTADPYKDMQLYKLRCLQKFISRHGHLQEPDRTNTLIHRCLVALKKHGARIKSYYSHPISTSSFTDDELESYYSHPITGYYSHPISTASFSDDELAFVMLLDGCFILHLLLEDELSLQPEEKHVPGRIWIWTLVKYDLLLLENQIPFFVVSELFDILGTEDDKKVDLIQRALDLFKDIQLPQSRDPSTKPNKVHHLLHLFYSSLLPNSSSLPPPPPSIWIPSATELNTEFGLKFDKNHEAKSFLDVTFCRKGITRKGVIEIPSITIDDHSKDLFRNLIAFEQCYPYTNCHVTVYASFMDCIISTESDVRLLHFEGILTNLMSADQEITHFFSQLCRGIHIAEDQFYLGELFNEVIKYQKDKCNKCWADFKLTYCGNSWAVFAGVVSVIFFVLTIVQTVYTIYPYYNPRE